jgi:hypothetical protein
MVGLAGWVLCISICMDVETAGLASPFNTKQPGARSLDSRQSAAK